MIDPENDLTPVCPNCHAMLHRKDPPYRPDELRRMIDRESRTLEYPTLRPSYRMAAENSGSEYGKDV